MKPFRRLFFILALVSALPVPARAGQNGRLTIQSSPPGASIEINGMVLEARTPVVIAVPPGQHLVRISKPGYETSARTVEAYSGTAFVNFSLDKAGRKDPEPKTYTSAGARRDMPVQRGPSQQEMKGSEPHTDKSVIAGTSYRRRTGPTEIDRVAPEPVRPAVPEPAPVKVSYRDHEVEKGPRPSVLNVLPEENPFEQWIDSVRTENHETGREQTPAEKPSDSPDDDTELHLASLRLESETSFPLIGPDEDEEEPGPGTDAQDEEAQEEFYLGPSEMEPEPEAGVGQEPAAAPGDREPSGGNDAVTAEPEEPASLIPEPEVKWPDSAEGVMFAATRDLPRFPEKFNILLLGLDRRDRRGILATGAEIPVERLRKRGGRSDVILVVQIDFGERQVRMVSVPRDTKAVIPGYRGHWKINAAYAFGRERLARRVIGDFLEIPIHRVVVVDWRGAKKCIGIFKGLGLDYNGYSDKELFWHLRKRSFPRGDFRRIERQQKFLRYAAGEYLRLFNEAGKAQGPMAVVKRGLMDMAIKQGLEVVETDLTYDEAKMISFALRDYNVRDMTMAQVRGRGVLEGADDEDGGVYFFKPYSHHSFQEIIAMAESGGD